MDILEGQNAIYPYSRHGNFEQRHVELVVERVHNNFIQVVEKKLCMDNKLWEKAKAIKPEMSYTDIDCFSILACYLWSQGRGLNEIYEKSEFIYDEISSGKNLRNLSFTRNRQELSKMICEKVSNIERPLDKSPYDPISVSIYRSLKPVKSHCETTARLLKNANRKALGGQQISAVEREEMKSLLYSLMDSIVALTQTLYRSGWEVQHHIASSIK